MRKRTAVEVGAMLRAHRERFTRHTQDSIEGVSPATVGKIERGTAETFRGTSLVRYLAALDLPPSTYDDLRAGKPMPAPASEIRWSASEGGSALDELRRTHPDQWARLNAVAESLLGR